MNGLMRLHRVVFDDNGNWDRIDPSYFIVYEVDPETDVVLDVERFIYHM